MAKAVYSGEYCYRSLVQTEQALKELGKGIAGNSSIYVGKGGHILMYPIEKGKTMNGWYQWAIVLGREANHCSHCICQRQVVGLLRVGKASDKGRYAPRLWRMGQGRTGGILIDAEARCVGTVRHATCRQLLQEPYMLTG